MPRLNYEVANRNLQNLESRNIRCLDSYKGKTADRHRFLCLVEGCGNIWEAPYVTVVTMGHGCRSCANKNICLPVKEAQYRLDNLITRHIKCLDEYKGTQANHKFQCLKGECGNVWETTYNNVVNRGNGCKKCAVRKTMTPFSEAQARLNKLVERDIVCLDTYKGSQLKHHFQCLKEECGHIWEAKYTAVVNRGDSCKACARIYISEEKAQANLNNLVLRNIRCDDKYKGSGKHHSFTCLVPGCDHEWSATYNDVVNTGYGCAKCAGVMKKTGKDAELTKLRRAIRTRIKNAVAGYEGCYSFSKYHKNQLIDYCVKEYLTILPKPHKDLTLDHILPLSLFNPIDDLEMKLCWNRRNLRWLTRVDNCKKNNKIIFDLFDDWHYLVYNLVSSGSYDIGLAESLLD
jgi:hypothetical protein